MKDRLTQIALPILGILAVLALWGFMSTTVPDLPSPLKTWQDSKVYIMEPLVKRGEMDQGIGLLAFQSLIRVAKGFLLGALIATPLGFLLGLSKAFNRMFDPVIQVLRPISPSIHLPVS